MEMTPIKVRPLQPPQDDLFAAISDSSLRIQEGDVVCVSSKVVAIHEGRCIRPESAEKQTLYQTQSDLIIPRPYWSSPLTVVHHTFLGAAGIDESNGNGYMILLPEDPFASAQRLHTFLCDTYNVHNIGVLITDSRSLPFRYGASGVTLGWWGIEPLRSHIGSTDVFGRALQYERSNVVDAIAAAANLVMGETDECQPVTVVRDIPHLVFTQRATKNELFSPYEDDTFRVLYERWLD